MIAMSKGRILVVDDHHPESFLGLSKSLSADGYDIVHSGTVEHASQVVERGDVDAVLTDVGFPSGDGMRLFDYISTAKPVIPVIFLTTYETIELAVTALTRGAFYYFVNPPNYPKLKSILARAVEHCKLKREIELLRGRLSEITPAYNVIGNSPGMRKALEVIEAARESAKNVLILGETGTGKELIARTLHHRSSRKTAPFISVRCAAIPGEFIETELFGYEMRSNTGLSARRSGKFEEAGNGIVFMDEIDQLVPATQAKVLQFLRDGCIGRTEAGEKIDVRFRLISTTTSDIEDKVERGIFSGDLYGRINEIAMRVPPLRERKEDIPLLATAFVDEFCVKQKRKVVLSGEVMRAFQFHDWPGNVRQLRNVVERAVVLARGGKITLRELPGEFLALKRRTPNRSATKTLKELEMQAIMDTLRKCNGNKSRTARMLGISRKAFYKRLREAGLS